jgi:hypothetical protein
MLLYKKLLLMTFSTTLVYIYVVSSSDQTDSNDRDFWIGKGVNVAQASTGLDSLGGGKRIQNENNWSSGQNLNSEPAKYEGALLAGPPQCFISPSSIMRP